MTSGCCGKIFLVFNFLFWLIGFATLGYAIWILVTTNNVSNFLSGTLVFTYSFLGIGILLVVTGLIGCIGACTESTCCLKAYIGLMTVVLLIDIGIAIGGGVQNDQLFDYTEDLWGEVNSETKNQIQNELECCGYEDPATEYTTGYPDSCFDNAQDLTSIHSDTCKDAMKAWVRANIHVWASVLGIVLLLQVISAIASCRSLVNIQKNGQVAIE